MMTEQEMRVAIAEACGWEPDNHFNEATHWHKGIWLARTAEELPDYLNDLNAMNEAEKVLLGKGDTIGMLYNQELFAITKEDWVWHATAKQRSIAFCRTLYPGKI